MKVGKLRWVIVSLVALATIINYIDRGALAVLWPEISADLGMTKTEQKNFSKLLTNLATLFEKEDCSIAEINPLILTEDEQVIALDAKVNFDSNAEFRHKEYWGSVRDLSEEAPTETEAQAAGLVDVLKSRGPFTVFAPTDEAFAKIPAAQLEAILADKQLLTDILTYHVVAGKVTASDVMKVDSATKKLQPCRDFFSLLVIK